MKISPVYHKHYCRALEMFLQMHKISSPIYLPNTPFLAEVTPTGSAYNNGYINSQDLSRKKHQCAIDVRQ
jgi:hypothetical protein